MTASAAYAATTEYLISLKARGLKFGVDRMALLAEALGHPEKSYPVVHVAGTNGKGSVSAMLESIFRAAGWRTGLYTSPHLVRLGERIQIDRVPMIEEEIVAYTDEIRPHAERLATVDPDDHPSFFEFMTGAAFLHFARKKIDIGVIEVGLGGRLDATNIVMPEVAVITSIGLDHCEILGDTHAQIAREKAGIVKPGKPVVVGRMPKEAREVVLQIARERGAPAHCVETVFGSDTARYPTTNLEGDYQRWNAATAVLVARLLAPRWRITDSHIETGLSTVRWPGRWQRLFVGGTPVILDASHNEEGAAVLDSNLMRLVSATSHRPIVVVGALGEMRARAVLATVARHACEIVLVVPHQQRASGYEVLEASVPKDFSGPVRRAVLEEIFPTPDRCAIAQPGHTVVVTGSIYLIGEVFAQLRPEIANEERLQDF